MAKEKSLKAREQVQQWVEDFKTTELPNHTWAKSKLEALGIRQVEKKNKDSRRYKKLIKPKKKMARKKCLPKPTEGSKDDNPNPSDEWFSPYQPFEQQQLVSQVYSQSAFMNSRGCFGTYDFQTDFNNKYVVVEVPCINTHPSQCLPSFEQYTNMSGEVAVQHVEGDFALVPIPISTSSSSPSEGGMMSESVLAPFDFGNIFPDGADAAPTMWRR